MAKELGPTINWQGVQKVLAVRLDNIGDVLLLGPALKAIKENLPDARLALLASPAGAQAADLLPQVDEVIVQKVIWQDVSGTMSHEVGREYRLIEQIRAQNFDAAFIFTSFSQSPYPPAYVCYLAGVPVRVGMSKEFGGALVTTWVRSPRDSQHQAERNLFLLEQIGFRVLDRDLAIEIPEESRDTLDQKLAADGIARDDDFVLVQPFASCQARTYPVERMAAVARGIVSDLRFPVVICGHERDLQRITEEGVQKWGNAVLLAGRTTLPEFAALVDRAKLVIGNNSSSLHLADALGTPCLATYSGTEYEEQWRPRQTRNLLLRKPTDCSPCFLFDCAYNQECLDFQPEEVLRAASSLMDGA